MLDRSGSLTLPSSAFARLEFDTALLAGLAARGHIALNLEASWAFSPALAGGTAPASCFRFWSDVLMSTLHSARVEPGQRMTQKTCDELREAIESASGNEIFAIGSLDEAGLVCEVEIVARGTADAVPALGPYFEKGSVLIHNHPSGFLQPSDADVAIAADAGTYGVGSYIVDNAVSDLFIVAEPVRRKSVQDARRGGIGGSP